MLRKLLKHELKASGRVMLPVLAASLLLSVLAGLGMRVMDAGVSSVWLEMVIGLIVTAFAFGLIALWVVAMVMMIERFRRNLLGDEGYLMFTLPVGVDTHVICKLLGAILWFAAAFVCFILSILLVMLSSAAIGGGDLAELIAALPDGFQMAVAQLGLGNTMLLILEVLALAVLGSASGCLMFYCAMAIGYSFSNNKLLWSIVAYFAMNFLVSLVLTGVTAATIYAADKAQVWANGVMMAHVLFGSLIAQCLVQCLVLYVPTRFLLQKKLNLP